MRFLPSDFFHESTEFLIHSLNYFHMGMVHEKNRDRKSCANVPLKSSEYKKKHLGVKKYIIVSYFEAKNMPKIAEGETLKSWT
jgi:hypothetical protein